MKKGSGTGASGVLLALAPLNRTRAASPEIIEELRNTKTTERSGRAQDKESEDAFEKLRRDGYM